MKRLVQLVTILAFCLGGCSGDDSATHAANTTGGAAGGGVGGSGGSSGASGGSSGGSSAMGGVAGMAGSAGAAAGGGNAGTGGGSAGTGGGVSAWPNADNTGVPKGTALTKYTGPCFIKDTVKIDAVDATEACLALLIRAPNVEITRSKVPRIDVTDDKVGSVTISDSSVLGGDWVGGTLWGNNITARRVNVTGGQHSVHCSYNCTVEDSWLHDQHNPAGGSSHNNAFLSNGGSKMVVRHNTLHCTAILNSTGGGCTADLSLFGDFDNITDVLVENNLMKANDSSISYCAYGGESTGKPYPLATQVRFIDNIFERGPNGKCGVYGAITSFDSSASGNVWKNNKWDDGVELKPSL